ncbi:MAG: TolC family protein [Candidatus Sulfotelmatobacter sp.]|jgi:outer membrane protein TolC
MSLLLRRWTAALLRSSLLLTSTTLLVGTQLPPSLCAQNVPAAPTPQPAPPAAPPQLVHLQDYSKPSSAFPHILQPYRPQQLAQPNLANSPRIDSLMRDGKIYLSIDDAVALTLENNLDIDIARYNLNIADTDYLRAKSGANILGVNAGIVQNTPGGGVGGLGGTVGSGTGGTTVAPSGVGTGTNGLVSSTLGIGSTITSFDPVVTSTLQLDKNDTESTSVDSVPILSQNTYTADFAYTQGFEWGTTLNAGFNNTHFATNNPISLLSPAISSNFQVRVTQNLLQGFGSLPNTRFIRIAKNNREISDVAFRLQIITTVDQIEDMYWDLVYAYENVHVQQEALTYAQKALDDSKQQAQVGTVPPIQVVSAQSTVSTDQQNLILAQNNLELEKLLVKNALSRSIEDPALAEADVIPTSTMLVPREEAVVPTQDLINQALDHRAELVESRIDLNSRDLSSKAVRNAMLPTLDAFAYYSGSGVGGNVNPSVLTPPCNPAVSSCFSSSNAPPPFVNGGPVGYGSTLNQLFNGTAPDKGVGLSLTIPLRNREAQANQVRAELEYRQAQVRLHQLENQVRIEVRNAQFDVKQNRAAVQAAQYAVDFARQTLDADQQKLKVGLTTTTAILQDASVLTTNESNLVSAKAAYEKSRVELDRATGLLLDHTGIDIAEATRGQVTHLPQVPYVAPRQDKEVLPSPQPSSAP